MSLFRFVFLLLLSLPVFAQDWPNKPVKFVSPYPPGGSVDPLARLVEHPGREIDAGDAAAAGVERQQQAGAHADLEHALARARLDRGGEHDPRILEDAPEHAVVDPRVCRVDPLDVCGVQVLLPRCVAPARYC